MKLETKYKYSPFTGSKLQKISATKFVDPETDRPIYLNPVPAVIAIIKVDSKVLLVKRAVDPYKDTWDLPGGFVEVDESLETALIRELKEELDLDIKSNQINYLGSFPGRYEFQGVENPTITTAFIINLAHVKDSLVAQDDINNLAFYRLQQIPYSKIGFPTVVKLLKEFSAS